MIANNIETYGNINISPDNDYELNESYIEKLNDSCKLIDCSPLKVTKKKKVDVINAFLKNKSQCATDFYNDGQKRFRY